MNCRFALSKYMISLVVLAVGMTFEFVASAQSSKNSSYYQSKGYQVFPELGFAIKAPVLLEDISSISDASFELNYAGVQSPNTSSMCFYQIMISKLPAGYKNYSESEVKTKVKEMIRQQMSSMRGLQLIYFSDNAYVGYVGETTHDGKKQKGVMFYRDGCIYAMTVITNEMLETRFNSFTNSIKFFPNESSSYLNSAGSSQRQYIKEIGVYVSAPCRLERDSAPNYDYIYTGVTTPDNQSTAEVYRVTVNLLPMKLSQMISSDREQIKTNIKDYVRSKGAYSTETIRIPSVLCYSVVSKEQGFNVKECVVLTDSAVIEFIVFTKKDVSPYFSRFINSVSTK